MESIDKQVGRLAETTGKVLGAIIALFFRFRVILQLLRHLQKWYRDITAYPQSKKSILLTFAIGSFLLSSTYAATTLIPVFAGILTGGVLVGSVAPPVFFTALVALVFLAFLFLIPLVLAPMFIGYVVREMGIILHTNNEKTLVQAPFRDDRPAFRDTLSLSIDGFKAGTIPFLYVSSVGLVWYHSVGLFHIINRDLLGSLLHPVGFFFATPVAFLGATLIPPFFTRYADTGRLSDSLSNPILFLIDLISVQYVINWLIGVGLMVFAVGFLAIIAFVSPFLVPTVGLPVIFLATIQAVHSFALGYKRSISVDDTEAPVESIDLDDKFILPFREGGVAMPKRDRSILVLGETGSGKTETIKLLAYQFQAADDDPLVVFDYKDDYKQFFRADHHDDDVIVLSSEGSTHCWNIFEEAQDPADYEELGKAVFAAEEQRSAQPYFPETARQVFVAILQVIDNADEFPDNPTNATLVNFFEEYDMADVHAILDERAEYEAVANHIDPEGPKSAASVYGNLQKVVREIFRGDFGQDPDDDNKDVVSIREYMHNPEGKVLLLDYPLQHSDTIKPIFRLFIDWAIRFGLVDQERDAYFVLDEFAALPRIGRLERLANAGRARGAYGILGLQAVSQLDTSYDSSAQDILSGLVQEVILRTGDADSVEYVRDRLGRSQRVTLQQGPTDRITRALTGRESEYNQVNIVEDYPISEAELQQFEAGEAIVLQKDTWQHGRLPMLENDPILAEQGKNPDLVREILDGLRNGDLDLVETTDQSTGTSPGRPSTVADGGSERDHQRQ